jgi:hypothetical protein
MASASVSPKNIRRLVTWPSIDCCTSDMAISVWGRVGLSDKTALGVDLRFLSRLQTSKHQAYTKQDRTNPSGGFPIIGVAVVGVRGHERYYLIRPQSLH